MSATPVFGDPRHPLARALGKLIEKKILLMLPGWLPQAQCRDWLAQLANCGSQPAQSHDGYVSWAQKNTEFRRTQELTAPRALTHNLLHRLEQEIPQIKAHFGYCPPLHEQPEFLRYRPGDFFKAHRDWNDEPIYHRRRLSLVLFLNDQATDPGYHGGILNLYVRTGPDASQMTAVPVPPAAGLLILFDSRLVHEVSPILSGERYTVVTWLAAHEDGSV